MLERENEELSAARNGARLKGIIAASPQMLNTCRTIEKVAPADVTTLIVGETGTGKEVLARALHDLSPRKEKPFAAINCAAIPENLLESELLAMRRALSRVRARASTARSNSPTAGRCSSMRLGICQWRSRSRCCVFCRNV